LPFKHKLGIANHKDPILCLAKKIQNSEDFPNGVNVNFVQITDKFNIKLRVYERGVGETLACGSGACATVAYLDLIGRINAKDKDVLVDLKGGKLLIGVKEEDRIFMVGDAEFVFEGQIEI
jgi:diaminopimelate epimerase